MHRKQNNAHCGLPAAGKAVTMITDKEKKNMIQFYRAVLSLRDEEECRKFFDDVATIKELIDLSARLEVARMLDTGAVFSEISKETGASSATISRVNKCLTYGEGGYKTVIDRITEK
jgi:TrpR-related protein YerC/YecD